MRFNAEDLNDGDLIKVRGGFGMEEPIWAEVTEVDLEGKNGRATIFYHSQSTSGRWCYMDQISAVKRAVAKES